MGLSTRKLLYLLAAACVLGGMSAHPSLALSPHLREGWVLGISYGYGRGKMNLFPPNPENEDQIERVDTGWQRGAVPQYRLGYAVVKNHLVLTFENRQWLVEQGVTDEELADKIRVNVQGWVFALTYFPANPYSPAGGFYLQAGAGWSNGRLTLLDAIERDQWGNEFEEIFLEDEAGSAFTGGLGYEFRLVPNAAAGFNVSVVYESIQGRLFDDAVSLPVTMTLNWYW